MALVDRTTLIQQLCPPLDHLLATQMVDEFISAERRFIQRDWEPAELDGGQFCEVTARAIFHIDSGNINHTKEFGDCCRYILNDGVKHVILPRQGALHLIRVLQTVYKFRSQRGAVHISPTYGPNHMDARFVVESIRWVMNEMLRMFWNGDREVVAKAVRELLQFDVPSIGKFGSVLLVQRTDLSAEEEILLLLHYAGETGFSRAELGRHAKISAPSVTRAVQKLAAPKARQIVQTGSVYRLTDLGSKRIREQLSSKLVI